MQVTFNKMLCLGGTTSKILTFETFLLLLFFAKYIENLENVNKQIILENAVKKNPVSWFLSTITHFLKSA